jgi:MobA/VirD2-like, nuclease domain
MGIAKISKGRSFTGIFVYLIYEKEETLLPLGRDEHRQKGNWEEVEIQRALDQPPELPREMKQRPNLTVLLETNHYVKRQIDERPNIETSLSHEAPTKQTRKGKNKRRKRGEIIAGNVGGRDEYELAREFEALAAHNPEVKCHVFHSSIRFAPEDSQRVTTELLAYSAERLVQGLGYQNSMWVAFSHGDHVHIVACRSDYDGRTIPDSNDYEKAEEIMQEIEINFGLRQIRPSREAMRRNPTQAEVKLFNRTGKLSHRVRLQEHIDALLDKPLTAAELFYRLHNRGIEVIPRFNVNHELTGICFRLDGKTMKGSGLGRGYSAKGLQQVWLNQEYRRGVMTYVVERDYAACSREGSQADRTERKGRATEFTGGRGDGRDLEVTSGRDECETGSPLPAPRSSIEPIEERMRATPSALELTERIEDRVAEISGAGARNPAGPDGYLLATPGSLRQSQEPNKSERGRPRPSVTDGGEARVRNQHLHGDGDDEQPYDRGVRFVDMRAPKRPVHVRRKSTAIRDQENSRTASPDSRIIQEEFNSHHGGSSDNKREYGRTGGGEDSLVLPLSSGRASNQPVIQGSSTVYRGFEDARPYSAQDAGRPEGGFPREAQARDEVEQGIHESARYNESFDQEEIIDSHPKESVIEQLEFNYQKCFELDPDNPRLVAGLLYGVYLIRSVEIAKKEHETNENLSEERRQLNLLLHDQCAAQDKHREQYSGESVSILSKEQKQYIEENLHTVYFGELRESIGQSLSQAIIIGKVHLTTQ